MCWSAVECEHAFGGVLKLRKGASTSTTPFNYKAERARSHKKEQHTGDVLWLPRVQEVR